MDFTAGFHPGGLFFQRESYRGVRLPLTHQSSVLTSSQGIMFEVTSEAPLRCSSILLEDGADEAWLNGEPIDLCEGGMCFPSRWEFEPGATLGLTLEICESGERAKVEVVVAGCERVADRLWSVTVLFLEKPCGVTNLKQSQPKSCETQSAASLAKRLV
jgi:hypothetical protein